MANKYTSEQIYRSVGSGSNWNDALALEREIEEEKAEAEKRKAQQEARQKKIKEAEEKEKAQKAQQEAVRQTATAKNFSSTKAVGEALQAQTVTSQANTSKKKAETTKKSEPSNSAKMRGGTTAKDDKMQSDKRTQQYQKNQENRIQNSQKHIETEKLSSEDAKSLEALEKAYTDIDRLEREIGDLRFTSAWRPDRNYNDIARKQREIDERKAQLATLEKNAASLGYISDKANKENTELKKRVEQYKSDKSYAEMLKDSETLDLVNALYNATTLNEDGSYASLNPIHYASNETSKKQAKEKLEAKGYDVDGLLAYYTRTKNAEITEKNQAEAKKIAEEHPILATGASFFSNAAQSAAALSPYGVNKAINSLVSDEPIDPNSPYFLAKNQTDAMRSTVEEKISSPIGKNAYQLGVTIGDMVTSKLVGGGAVGYSALMAGQAASSSAQDAANRGLSNDEIIAESVGSAILTFACEKIGFDKVFSGTAAATSVGIKTKEELAKVVGSSFLSEASEEATEEILNTVIDSIIGGGNSSLNTAYIGYINQGFSDEAAKLKAIQDKAKEVGKSFLMGGLSGGIISGVPATINYTANTIQNKADTAEMAKGIVQDDENGQNIENSPTSAPLNVEVDKLTATQSKSVQSENIYEFSQRNTEVEQGNNSADTAENEVATDAELEATGWTKDGDFWLFPDDELDISEATQTSTKAAEIVELQNQAKAVINNPKATQEQKNQAQKTAIEQNYAAEMYEGTKEHIDYGSGVLDVFVNPKGKTITADIEAEQKLINFAQQKFNANVRFVNDIDDSINGYYDKNNKEIVISRNSTKGALWTFGHEFTHSLEGTVEFKSLKNYVLNNSRYIIEKIEINSKNGVSDFSTLVNSVIAKYADRGIKISVDDAETELVADFVADEMFSDYRSMEQVATQNRSVFIALKQWFERTFFGDKSAKASTTTLDFKKSAKITYSLLLKAERSALNGDGKKTAQIGKKFSISDTIDNLTKRYSFDEQTAAKVDKVAAEIRKSFSGRKSIDDILNDVAELAHKKSTNEDISETVERMARLIADNAPKLSSAVNESFVSERKEAIKLLRNSTWTLGEYDVKNLPESVKSINNRLMGYVRFKKGETSNVDTLFQSLPDEFFSHDISNTADQVEAIIDFVEDYKAHKTINPFDSKEAFDELKAEIKNLAEAFTPESNAAEAEEWAKRVSALTAKYVDKYGEKKNYMPRSIDGETRTRTLGASVLSSESVRSNPKLAEKIAQKFLQPENQYEVTHIDQKAADYIQEIKSTENVAQTLMDEVDKYEKKLAGDRALSVDDVIRAYSLASFASDYLDDDAYIDYVSRLSTFATEQGKVLYALRLAQGLTQPQKTKYVKRMISQLNETPKKDFTEKAKNLAGVTDIAFDNEGKIEHIEVPENSNAKIIQTKSGTILEVGEKRISYQPVIVSNEDTKRLLKAKDNKEFSKVAAEIRDKAVKDSKTEWSDKLTAWRYLSMLCNPSTWMRNAAGNTAMFGMARVKDTVAAALETKLAKNKDIVQTHSLTTSHEAREAAKKIYNTKLLNAEELEYRDKYTGENEIIAKKQRQSFSENNPFGRGLNKIADLNNEVLNGEKIGDQAFRRLSATSVLAQTITKNVANGKIKSIDDFLSVVLDDNAVNSELGELAAAKKTKIDIETIKLYKRIYSEAANEAIKRADENTFHDKNELVEQVINIKRKNKAAKAVIEGTVPFLNTPANIVKRAFEYSGLGLTKTLTADYAKLKNGEISANQFIENASKGMTGTAVSTLGFILAAVGVIGTSDNGDDDEARRKLLNGQEYAIRIGNRSWSLNWLAPSAVPLFMGVSFAETLQDIVTSVNGTDKDILQLLTWNTAKTISTMFEPIVNMSLLSSFSDILSNASQAAQADGADGQAAFLYEFARTTGESFITQALPSFVNNVANVTDNTVRTYYTDRNSNLSPGMQSFITSVKRKIPGLRNTTPAFLDAWLQPKKNGSLPEKLYESFAGLGYIEKENNDASTKALIKFADDNEIGISEIAPQKYAKKLKASEGIKYQGEHYHLTADEYEEVAAAVGNAYKKAVDDYLIKNKSVEISYQSTTLKPENKSGTSKNTVMFKGDIEKAHNKDWVTSDGKITDKNGKVTELKYADDEEFRAELWKKLIDEVVNETISREMAEVIKKRTKNKRSDKK